MVPHAQARGEAKRPFHDPGFRLSRAIATTTILLQTTWVCLTKRPRNFLLIEPYFLNHVNANTKRNSMLTEIPI